MTKVRLCLKNINCQEGITLLLGILVLSAILAISFSLASILFVEVRSSGDLLRTETSYYGAQAVTEEALYKFKRQVASSTCGSALPNCYSPKVGTVDLQSNPPFENPITDPVQQDIVPQGGSSPGDGRSFSVNAKHYTIYNPACPAAGSAAQAPYCTSGGSGYGKIIVTYKDSNNNDALHAYLCQFNPGFGIGINGSNSYATPPCADPTSSEYWLSNGKDLLMSSGASQSWILDPNQQQELILFNPGTSGPIYVQIETFDAASSPKGIPYFQQTAVDINAQNAGVNRKIRVLIPSSSGGLVSSGGSVFGYAHHRQITINAGQVPSPQSNFPMLINITDAATIASFKSAVTSAQGYDIQFAQNSDGSGVLNSEVESYDSTTGKLVAWVNLPIAADGVSFYIFYGKPGAGGPPNSVSAVWDGNYKGVWHLPNGTSLTANDSTAGINSGTLLGAVVPNATTGQAGGGANFNGSSGYIGVANPSNFNFAASAFTLEAWIKTGTLVTNKKIITKTDKTLPSTGFEFIINYSLAGSIAIGNAGFLKFTNNLGVNNNIWHNVAAIYDGSGSAAGYSVYLDGVNQPLPNVVGAFATAENSKPVIIGSSDYFAAGEYFSGAEDEVRVSSIARAASWINTEYNNQSSPGSFYNLGAEQTP